jgi:hypothetical protein
MMNDNLPLLLRTRGILNRWRNAVQLEEKHHQTNSERQTEQTHSDEQKAEQQREYVETRLRELRAFERRMSGK